MNTPQTDAACGWPWGHHGRIECGDLRWSPDGPFVHSEVARQLERELNVANNWVEHHQNHCDDLIKENARLRMELDASCNAEELRQVRAENGALRQALEDMPTCRCGLSTDEQCALSVQNAALRKDKDRFDWLITKAPFCVLSTLSSDPAAARLKIDREMEFPTV